MPEVPSFMFEGEFPQRMSGLHCLLPKCPIFLPWTGVGRIKHFCEEAHRKEFAYQRMKLIETRNSMLKELETSTADRSKHADSRRARKLRSQIGLLNAALVRYPELSGS